MDMKCLFTRSLLRRLVKDQCAGAPVIQWREVRLRADEEIDDKKREVVQKRTRSMSRSVTFLHLPS
jgi:hypothetical protein